MVEKHENQDGSTDDDKEDDVAWGYTVETPKRSQNRVPLESLKSDDKEKLSEKIMEINPDVPLPYGESLQFLKEQIEAVLSTLTPREHLTLQLRFGLLDGRARTLEEVAKEFDLTP